MPLYIVAIAWGYIVILMAATEPNLVAALLTFAFYGAIPLSLVLWLLGAPERKRRRLRCEAQQDASTPPDVPH